jgi:drug/metabolite transporter (DMT)-like permease
MSLESFPPAMLMALRFSLSGSILLIAARVRGSHLPHGRELLYCALSGILTIGGGTGALVWAEQLIPSGLASLIITLQPFWFVILEAVLPRGTRPHAPTVFGMVIGFLGTSLLFLPGSGSAHLGAQTLIGFLILQVGCACWVMGSLLQRRRPSKAHPVVTGAVQQLAASLAFVPLALLVPHAPIVLKARAVWALLYLVTFGSIVGYSAYIYAIHHLPVAIVSIYPYVNAVVAVTLGWVFYREPFGPREFLAMIIIFAGVGIVKWQSARAERARAQVQPA